jgi:branched-chain amino acid transport system substrate-binding protein
MSEGDSTNFSRRRFLKGTAATAAAAATMRPGYVFGSEKTVKIGFNAPLTGPVSAWGLPGLYGCRIWADRVNKAGGIKIGDTNYMVEFVKFDNEYSPAKARTGARKLIEEDNVKFIMMLGGDTWGGVQSVHNRANMLSSTLLPSDLSTNTPYHLAPCETHPIYNVTGVDWMADQHPELKTAVMAAQDDDLGKPSVATFSAAFEARGIEMVREAQFYDPGTTDFAPIVSTLLAEDPDIFCLDTAYKPAVHALTKELQSQGFDGQLISCTCDGYPELVDKVGNDYMDGFIFQFPDFDDPMLQQEQVNFTRPTEFFEQYEQRWPGEWSAVSWEYPGIMDLWKASAEKAQSIEPMDVLEAMKADKTAPHVFGEGTWWGEPLWGIDNALVGPWPVVQVNDDGKARIQEFRDIRKWLDKHQDLLLKHFDRHGLLPS